MTAHQTSRRAILAGASAIPFAAFASTAAPALSPTDNSSDVACLVRAEHMVATLRERFIRPNWSIDEAAAERALRFFRAEAAGVAYDQDEYEAAIAFVSDHGVSLDWIFDGKIGPTICREASASPRARKIAANSDPIFAAIEAHRCADAQYLEAARAADIPNGPRREARVLIGYDDDGVFIRSKTDELGSYSLTWVPNGKKTPLYARDRAGIEKSVPRDLQGSAQDAWVAQRVAKLEKEKDRISKAAARTKLGKLEAIREKFSDLERDRMWELIWTVPITLDGLLALLRYGPEKVFHDEWELALEWTIECAVCALGGLPEPPKSDLVAELWNQAFTDPIEPPSGSVSSAASAAA
jgi:hypothetical protein